MQATENANKNSFYHLGTPEQGVANIVNQVLSLRRGDRLVIILDRCTAKFMAGIEALAVERLGRDNVCTHLLEEFGERDPARQQGLDPETVRDRPDFRALLNELEQASAGLFAAVSLGREVALRDSLRIHGCARGGRFLHLPNMTPDILCMGFCADQQLVHHATQAMAGLLRKARWARVTSRAGADLWVALGYRWIAADSLLQPGTWANVGAEMFTCPVAIDGLWVADGGMGDVFTRYGLLTGQPLEFTLQSGMIVRVASRHEELATHYRNYAAADLSGNGLRIGEFALPTNPELTAAGLIGVNMQDEKALVHLASGYPRADETLRDIAPEAFWWHADTHVDFSARGVTVTLHRSVTDRVEVLSDDYPAEALWQALGNDAPRLQERLDHIREHIRRNEARPPEQRVRRITFD